MGLRVEKSVSSYPLMENSHGSNLLPPISKVDYLEGHLGPAHLRPRDGLPAFVNDVYRYLATYDAKMVFSRKGACLVLRKTKVLPNL